MAAVARLVSWNVVRRLAYGDHAVVTTDAGAENLIVIDADCRDPTGGGVARIAVARGGDMRGGPDCPIVRLVWGQ